jgi:protein gp37
VAEVTKISWAHSTFNGWLGCQKVSEACRNCYAERDTKRFGRVVWGPDAERVVTSDENWRKPLSWNKKAMAAGEPWRVFCSSLSDVFEDRRDLDPHRRRLWDLIEATPALTWMLLTKRPQNMRRFTPSSWSAGWPRNVWAGTSTETQKDLEERAPHLVEVPAVVRFLSCEPLLGMLDLRAETLRQPSTVRDGIEWVIVGGESGPHARPMHPGWARAIRDECAEAGVAFHFKQWGEFVPREDDRLRVVNLAGGHGFHGEGAIYMERIGKKAAASLLDGVDHKAFPEAAP